MKYWKNITIDLPEMNLNDAMDKLLEMNNVVNITILYIFSPYKLKPFHEM